MNNYAIVFPGQGSQSVGMLAELAERFPIVKQTFEQAGDALAVDLWTMTANGPDEELNKTYNTQPAMLAGGIAVWRVMQESGIPQPALLAGHSLGEYSALVAAGALGFEDAARLVAERGRLMQQAVPAGEGAMAAILGLDDDQVRSACSEAAAGQVVEAVNFNSPGQVVIAGNRAAVERAIEQAKSAGAKRALLLSVSVPSHCALMKPAAEQLAERLADISLQLPRIPVLHNVNVATADSPEAVRELLVAQLHSPVRWVETVQAIKQAGNELVVEAGPGKVLAGLCKRIDRAVLGLGVYDSASLDKALEKINA